jgi:chromosome segregation ATPase
VKHLLYEHQHNVTTLKADGEMALKLQQDDYRKREGDLSRDKRSLKVEIKESELSHQDTVRQLKLEQAKEITKLRQEYELQARELQLKYEKKMKILRDDLELRRKQEIHEIEERKNSHINELMRQHERAFAEIKNYYNDITHNNLDLIKTLKEDVAEMKKREAQNEKLMYEIAQENKRLSEPLAKALKEVEALRSQLTNYEADKEALRATKVRLANAEKSIRNLEWEGEVAAQRFDKVQGERDELYGKFEASIYDVQQKTGALTAAAAAAA